MPEPRRVETLPDALGDLERRVRVVEALSARAPSQSVAMELANQSVNVTSGSFGPTAHLELPAFYGQVWNVRFVVITDASTTAELRLRQEFSGRTTSVATVGAGLQRFVDFEWLHEVPLATTYEHFMIEARRASGAGNIAVFYPRRCLFDSQLRFPAASTTGNPTVF